MAQVDLGDWEKSFQPSSEELLSRASCHIAFEPLAWFMKAEELLLSKGHSGKVPMAGSFATIKMDSKPIICNNFTG